MPMKKVSQRRDWNEGNRPDFDDLDLAGRD